MVGARAVWDLLPLFFPSLERALCGKVAPAFGDNVGFHCVWYRYCVGQTSWRILKSLPHQVSFLRQLSHVLLLIVKKGSSDTGWEALQVEAFEK